MISTAFGFGYAIAALAQDGSAVPRDSGPLPAGAGWTTVDLLWLAGSLVVAVLAAVLLHKLVFHALERLARHTAWQLDDILVRRLRRPGLLVLLLLSLQLAIHACVSNALRASELLRHVSSLASIATITWLVVAAIQTAKDHFKGHWRIDVDDNLAARRVHTQVDVLARTLAVFAIVLGLGAALTTFPRVRELGTSLLASAGVAGLVAGLAARPLLENLIAGVQIALTQPIRLDDVVVIDGEQGRIEDIRGTYVVVRIWDERRLIVPFSRVIQQSFQNWTLTSAHVLGTVVLHTDFDVSIAAVRRELERIVKDSKDWDGRVCKLQVTDATATTLELRAVVSAADADRLWSLSVHVREKLVEYLQGERAGARIETSRTSSTLGGP